MARGDDPARPRPRSGWATPGGLPAGGRGCARAGGPPRRAHRRDRARAAGLQLHRRLRPGGSLPRAAWRSHSRWPIDRRGRTPAVRQCAHHAAARLGGTAVGGADRAGPLPGAIHAGQQVGDAERCRGPGGRFHARRGHRRGLLWARDGSDLVPADCGDGFNSHRNRAADRAFAGRARPQPGHASALLGGQSRAHRGRFTRRPVPSVDGRDPRRRERSLRHHA